MQTRISYLTKKVIICARRQIFPVTSGLKVTSSPDEAQTYYKNGEEQLEIRLSRLHFKSKFLICRYVDARRRNRYYCDKKSKSHKRLDTITAGTCTAAPWNPFPSVKDPGIHRGLWVTANSVTRIPLSYFSIPSLSA